VHVCVDGRGVLAGLPQLVGSSGDAELDGAALRIARAGAYARAEQDGRPVPHCAEFRFVFQLR
jgi:outer membrane biosynthesis protein TonB